MATKVEAFADSKGYLHKTSELADEFTRRYYIEDIIQEEYPVRSPGWEFGWELKRDHQQKKVRKILDKIDEYDRTRLTS